jgi:hypothetical protein
VQATSASTWGDPAVYKSGDADRVSLNGSGISVVHYDIFSGPGVVHDEIGGREKLCTIHRIVWDKQTNKIWFGGNHGFAVGIADAPNTPTCNGAYPGHTNPGNCAVVWEHAHPAISECGTELDQYGGCSKAWWLTDAYFGVAIDPAKHDIWLGGANRSTKFHIGTYGGDLNAYYWAADDTEQPAYDACQHSMNCGMSNRWDLWPDQVPEWDASHQSNASRGVNYVTPLQRSTLGATKPDYALDDAVSGIAALRDGTAWYGSFAHGLIHVDSYGSRLGDATSRLMTKYVSALSLDPIDDGVWAGMAWGYGITRLSGGSTVHYSYGAPYDSSATLGEKLGGWAPVSNIQSAGAGTSRKMVAGFHKFGVKDSSGNTVWYAGAVAIYKGR